MLVIVRGRQSLRKVAKPALRHYGAGHIGARSFSPGTHSFTQRSFWMYIIVPLFLPEGVLAAWVTDCLQFSCEAGPSFPCYKATRMLETSQCQRGSRQALTKTLSFTQLWDLWGVSGF